jgi:hypothetical protein
VCVCVCVCVSLAIRNENEIRVGKICRQLTLDGNGFLPGDDKQHLVAETFTPLGSHQFLSLEYLLV